MFSSSRLRGAFTWLVSAAIALTGAVTTAATPAFADVRVPHALFGVHDGTPTSSSYAQIHEGSVRLWDVGAAWNQVETTKGSYDWTRLDQLVSAAQARHAEVTMVIALIPSFYSSSPTKPPAGRDAYRAFVAGYRNFARALMVRYRSFNGHRGISAYQVWNEGNIETFWGGTPAQLAGLTKTLHDVRNATDKGAKVIAPPMVTRLPYQLDNLTKYYRQRVARKAVWRYVDAIALSLYPVAKIKTRIAVPEDTIVQLRAVRKRLRGVGVPRSVPLWNTEVNYGLQSGGGGQAVAISATRQASNVMRTYLLNAANGIRRVFWYRYDWGRVSTGGTLGNTLLTSPDNSALLTTAGHTYLRAQRWMHGKLLAPRGTIPCPKDRHGTYTCRVKDGTGVRYIYWNPFRGAKVRLPSGVHHRETVVGGHSRVRPRSLISVSYAPVMISH
jgi:hypothetical protein